MRLPTNSGKIKPVLQPFGRFGMDRHAAFLAAFPEDIEYAVAGGLPVVADLDPRNLADAAAGIGQDGEYARKVALPVGGKRFAAPYALSLGLRPTVRSACKPARRLRLTDGRHAVGACRGV